MNPAGPTGLFLLVSHEPVEEYRRKPNNPSTEHPYQLHSKWKIHQGFAGTGLRSIEREGRKILEVPDGIVFPILAALSAFAVKMNEGWVIRPPKAFKDEELIQAAKSVYVEIADHNPQTMGKSRACYSALFQITSIYRKLLN